MPKFTALVLEPIEWDYDDTVWIMRHDSDIATKWMAPNDEGMLTAPPLDKIDEVLAQIIDPTQANDLFEAVDKGTWPKADRYKAVNAWYAYMTGRIDRVNANKAAADTMRKWIDKLDEAGAKRLQEIADAAITTDEDEQAPLGDA